MEICVREVQRDHKITKTQGTRNHLEGGHPEAPYHDEFVQGLHIEYWSLLAILLRDQKIMGIESQGGWSQLDSLFCQ